jgi:uncharacterized membrane protein (DUF4010 family)
MAPNPLPALVGLLVATLLNWWLEQNVLFLRRHQKRALQVLLLAALASLTAYVSQAVAREPGIASSLVGLLAFAVGDLALRSAGRMA